MRSTPVRGIIFDLDGTLIDSRKDLTTAINLMRAEYHLPPLALEAVTGFVGDGARKLVERSLQGTTLDPAAALARFKHHYDLHIADETCCYPGVEETLRVLQSRRVRCAIITNKPEAATRTVLRLLHLDQYFDSVVGGDTTPHLKPDPRSALMVLERWGLTRVEALIVGDNHTDIAAAKRAGIRSVFVTYGIGAVGEEKPDFVFDKIEEILALAE